MNLSARPNSQRKKAAINNLFYENIIKSYLYTNAYPTQIYTYIL